jgi:hypothetical protein
MPDRFATGASAIRPTPDAHLSRFHWDRLASSGGKPTSRLPSITGSDPGCSLIGISKSSILETDALAGVTVL